MKTGTCPFYDPLEILIWSYCIDRGIGVYYDPLKDRILFLFEGKTKKEIGWWELSQFVNKFNIKYDEIIRRAVDGMPHNWISNAKRPEVLPAFINFVNSLETELIS
ncbi:MAG: hypothetical protein V4721_10265 [Bacteroidota bacterium]